MNINRLIEKLESIRDNFKKDGNDPKDLVVDIFNNNADLCIEFFTDECGRDRKYIFAEGVVKTQKLVKGFYIDEFLDRENDD